ncbi:MAG: GtrA family protein [Polyangia bacterium]|jgi:putative flippase GtrA|nr:GtrA family protein [Polyangia bacterium]
MASLEEGRLPGNCADAGAFGGSGKARSAEAKAQIWRFSRFCLVGLLSLAVDFAVFVPLVHPGLLDPRVAALLAYLAASLAGYFLNRRITFSDRLAGPASRGVLAYIMVGLAGAAIRLAILHLLMVFAFWDSPPLVYLASGLGVFGATLASYLGALKWVFPAAGLHEGTK